MVQEPEAGGQRRGWRATIPVAAYPNRQFEGRVLKIEPQAQIVQNVTMFPVLINIENPGHLLKPGMNTEVRIHIGQRQGVLAVPNAALRTQRDVAAGASVLGLDPQAVQQLAAAQLPDGAPRPGGDSATAARRPRPHVADSTKSGATFTTPNGRTIALPPGGTAEQGQAAVARRRSGGGPTPADRALLAQVFGRAPRPGGGGGGAPGRQTRNGAGGGAEFSPRGGAGLPRLVPPAPPAYGK